MQYDLESNILYWEITAKGTIDHCLELGNFIIHLSKARQPILIEILNASKFVGDPGQLKDLKNLKKQMMEAG